jgi:cytochrome c553
MKELGMVLVGIFTFGIFFSTMIYPNLEYTGYQSAHTCTGECYEEYVRVHGTTVEILQAKQLADAGDPFSSIRGLWAGCAACHGQEGQGMAVFPKLAGQSQSYIVGRLNAYRNRETVGAMSSTMWGQAEMLSDNDIELLGEFIQETMK